MHLRDLVVIMRKTLSILVMGLLSVGYVAASPVFINEIHYGGETGEAIEIAGPVGTSLDGWEVIFYDGSSGKFYMTYSLTGLGLILDLENGFGVVSVEVPGIKNEAQDGLALVNAMNDVVQFLSYDGSFTAENGPAEGMTSTDIGVSENADTSIGYFQLIGLGTDSEDFSWDVASMNADGKISFRQTFGKINGGQTFAVPEPHTVFLLLMGVGFLWLQRKVIKPKRAMMRA